MYWQSILRGSKQKEKPFSELKYLVTTKFWFTVKTIDEWYWNLKQKEMKSMIKSPKVQKPFFFQNKKTIIESS